MKHERKPAHDIAERLQRAKEEILVRWEAIVRRELEDARRESRPSLRNSLPKFLDRLAEALEEQQLSGPVKSSLLHVATEHAEDRSLHTDYTIEEVIREYELLRKVIFDVLEEEHPLLRSARETILDAVTAGMSKATGQFAEAAAKREDQIQGQLEETTDLFKTIFELAAAGKALIDSKDGRFLRVNRKLCELLGYEENELIGKTFTSVTYADDRQWQFEKFEASLKDKSHEWSLEKRYLRKDGTHLWVLVSAAVIKDKTGEPTRIISTVIDISEQKRAQETAQRAEEALRESELRFRTLADSIPQLAWVADPTGHITWFNRRWYEYTGLSEVETAGTDWIAKIHHPDFFQKSHTRYMEFIRSGDPWEDIFPIRNESGEFRWFLSRAHPFRNSQGEIIQWFGTNTDITNEKRANDLLEEERVLREQFVNTLTHDLRTPLSAIKMSAQILKRRPGDAAAIGDLTDRILDNVRRGDKMIQDLLDASRVRAGAGLSVEIQPMGMLDVVRDTIGNLTSIHGDRFQLVATGSFHGYWCSNAIRRIVENLCSNAVKYGATDRPITVRLEDLSEQVRLSVHNEGQPISQEELASLFGAFKRSVSAERSRTKGWGIGLTIVQGLTDAHCGRVDVESSKEQGTKFQITFPRDSRPCQAERLGGSGGHP